MDVKLKSLVRYGKKLSTLFFTDRDNNFLDQRIPSGEYFDMWDGRNLSARSWNRVQDINKQQSKKPQKKRRMTVNPLTNKRVMVGSPAWTQLNKDYNWDGQNFTDIRKSVKIDRQLENDDILKNELAYRVLHIHTDKGDMHKDSRGSKKKTHNFTYHKENNEIYASNRNGSNSQKVTSKYCKVDDFGVDKKAIQEFCNKMVEYIKKGETGAPQYLLNVATYDVFSKINEKEKEKEMMYLKDKRAPNKRVLLQGHEKNGV